MTPIKLFRYRHPCGHIEETPIVMLETIHSLVGVKDDSGVLTLPLEIAKTIPAHCAFCDEKFSYDENYRIANPKYEFCFAKRVRGDDE